MLMRCYTDVAEMLQKKKDFFYKEKKRDATEILQCCYSEVTIMVW